MMPSEIDKCVNVDYCEGQPGLIKVFATGRIETRNPAFHYGDLVTRNKPPDAPIGGVKWIEFGRGYIIWCTDGTVYDFHQNDDLGG